MLSVLGLVVVVGVFAYFGWLLGCVILFGMIVLSYMVDPT